ncbi:hypothetical protein BDM02DRAFT_3091246 [Thelephora ganbajun]|uniref:Uncharacterized protein n=1 Tax=Thelephora ganbajun TaxID=370292 RepID=A0ACB6ZNV0_THEGA|nr:hypothetical protein BDM02DRAFT_3091246 [Thelephora ganbajun]
MDVEGGPSSKATSQVKKSKSRSQGLRFSKPSKSAPPTTHHRHRPAPLFRRDAQVERLLHPPILFQPSTTVLTNSFTSSARTTKRLERSWSRNVGPGPVHELLEDRAWYKEAIPDAAVASEAGRRPVVYDTVKLEGKYQMISERSVICAPTLMCWCKGIPSEASSHLIHPTGSGAHGLCCHFGPFDSQTKMGIKPLESINLSEAISQSDSHVFNAGGPVWGLDWCPIHPDDREHISYRQYMAVGTHPFAYTPNIGVRVSRPSPSSIQIWSFGLEDGKPTTLCEALLCIESGHANELKWCPLPSHDPLGAEHGLNQPRKLGLLAGTFEDGSFSVFVVPHPKDLQPPNIQGPIYVKVEPILCVELQDTSCWAFDWANSEVVAIGCTNGAVAIYNISDYLKEGKPLDEDILPQFYTSIHQSAVRAVSWMRIPPSSPSGSPLWNEDPVIIATGGYDGAQGYIDLRDGVMNEFNRTRDVVNDISFSPYIAGAISIDHENSVKVFSASPSLLGKGHNLFNANGPIWSIGPSDYHPYVATGCADGSCITTNMLRPPRRGDVPFFYYKIYQLDYSRNTGEYRMLEQFLPQETLDRFTAKKARSKNPETTSAQTNPGAWAPEVSVQRVVWNNGNGLGNCQLLVSGTASGLCRIDWVSGRWFKGRDLGLGGIETLRGEVDGGGDVDMDDAEGEGEGEASD